MQIFQKIRKYSRQFQRNSTHLSEAGGNFLRPLMPGIRLMPHSSELRAAQDCEPEAVKPPVINKINLGSKLLTKKYKVNRQNQEFKLQNFKQSLERVSAHYNARVS